MKQYAQTKDKAPTIGMKPDYDLLQNTLDVSTELANSSRRGACIIFKNVAESYLERTVLDLVRYMWNPVPDEENPSGLVDHPYREVAETCSNELDKSIRQPSRYEYLVCAAKPKEGLIRLDLEKKLSEYVERIVWLERFEDQGKIYENHMRIQLVVLLRAQRKFRSRMVMSFVYGLKQSFSTYWAKKCYGFLRPS